MLLQLVLSDVLAEPFLAFEDCLAFLPLDQVFSGLMPEQLVYA